MSPTSSKSMAALWMGGWLTLMLIMPVAGREAMRELHVLQLMELRSTLGLFLLYPMIRRAGGLAAMKTSRLPQHIARNLVHYAAQLGWFLALSLIPIGEVVAIEFTMPIWTAFLAVSFLSERMTSWKIAAVVLGLIGVVIIVRPAAGEVNWGQVIALGAAVCFSVSMVLMKSLMRTESALRVLFWMLLVQAITGLLPTLYLWVWPSAVVWGWIIVITLCGTFSHYCLASAMRYADATVVVPMDFLRVPLTATAGWLVYSERLDAWTVLGAALILVGNLLNLKATAPRPVTAAVNRQASQTTKHPGRT